MQGNARLKVLVILFLYLCFNKVETQHSLNKSSNSGFAGGTCLMCTVLMRHSKATLEQHGNITKIVEMIKRACILLRLETPRVCKGGIEVFGKQAAYVLSKVRMTPEEMCFLAFPDQCSLSEFQFDITKWKIAIPEYPEKRVIKPSPTRSSESVLKVLHISDVHVDHEYSPGSSAECGEPLCCRKQYEEEKGYYSKILGNWSSKAYSVVSKFLPQNDTGTVLGAGKWGDYRQCDLPPWTFENLLATVSKGSFKDQYEYSDTTAPLRKVDYIIWTGDITSHDIWNQNQSTTWNGIQYLTKILLKYFPNTRVFPSTGNHDSFPSNIYPLPHLGPDKEKALNSSRWIYNALAEVWSPWLPTEALETVRLGAYYTVLVHPGFRIVSLNTNFCYSENLLIYLRPEDPAGMLVWFVEVLLAAEKAGEKVHVLGHVPPGRAPDCLSNWSENYYRILERFENTITAQFFGHTHFDEIELFYGEANDSAPNSVAYLAPSVTPYIDMNPGFRVYDVDGFYSNSSWSVLNHRTYILSLDEVNRSDDPKWQLEYDALNSFSMDSLMPIDWENLVATWLEYFEFGTPTDPPTSLKKYLQHYSKGRFLSHGSTVNNDRFLSEKSRVNSAASQNTNLPCETIQCARMVVCNIVKNKEWKVCLPVN